MVHMVSLCRPPVAALRGLVTTLWSQDAALPGEGSAPLREHVLPTGATHIALRIGGPPLLLFDDTTDVRGHRIGHAVVGGARTRYHVRDVTQPVASVGAMLRPGAARVLLGVPESALAGHHTPLELLLSAGEVDALLEGLQACGSAAARLALFEQWLMARARGRPPVLHPALVRSMRSPLTHDMPVAAQVRASGLSHRHYIALFREAVGLTPREWLALQRFGQVLSLAAQPLRGWADIAADCGFADQAHLANSFRTFAGFTPADWRRRVDPGSPRHVAV
jgi:AraC-like DNA-binding protein